MIRMTMPSLIFTQNGRYRRPAPLMALVAKMAWPGQVGRRQALRHWWASERSLRRIPRGGLPAVARMPPGPERDAALHNAVAALARCEGAIESVLESPNARARLPVPCDHDWRYFEDEENTYTGYLERCSKCGDIMQIPP